MSFFKYIYIIAIFVSSDVYARGNVREPFTVTIQAFFREVITQQKEAELRMSQNSDYCRGTMMPIATGNWNCVEKGSQIRECVLIYNCRPITKERSRITEAKRLREELSKLPKVSNKAKLVISKKPELNINRKIITEITAPEKVGSPSGVVLTREELEKVRQGGKVIMPEAAPAPAAKAPEKHNRKEVTVQIDETEDNDLGLLFDDEPRVKKERVRKEDDQNDGRNETGIWSKTYLKSFLVSMINAKDDYENSQSTFGVAWTPYYMFTDHWLLRGHLGYHSLSLDFGEGDESFGVYELGVFAQYFFQNIYFEIGFGMYKWNDSYLGETYNTMSFGGGYRFSEPFLKYIDRVFVNSISVSNDVKSSELRFGLGISF